MQCTKKAKTGVLTKFFYSYGKIYRRRVESRTRAKLGANWGYYVLLSISALGFLKFSVFRAFNFVFPHTPFLIHILIFILILIHEGLEAPL